MVPPIIRNQLQVNGIGHMMKSRDYQRRIDNTENSCKYNLKGSCNPGKNKGGNCRSNLPANWAQYKMRRYYRQ